MTNYNMITEMAFDKAVGEQAKVLVMATPSARVRNLKQAHRVALDICNKVGDNDTAVREAIYVCLAEQSGLNPFKV